MGVVFMNGVYHSFGVGKLFTVEVQRAPAQVAPVHPVLNDVIQR